MFFVIIYTLKVDANKKIFFYVILICCLFVALDNIFQYFVGQDIFGFKKSGTRLTGPFGDKEFVSGSYLAKFSIILLPLFFLRKKLFNFFILSFLIVFFFLSILITGERASALIFIIGVLCYYLFDFRNIKIYFICSIFIFLILMVIFNKNTNYNYSYQIEY